MSNISVLILAAGKGVRMKSDLPKVLHSVGRIPMIERVVRSTLSLKPDQICVIVGHGGDAVKTHLHKTFPKQKISYVTQKVLNGSGGAVRQSLSWLKKQRGEVLVCCGDAPLIPSETFQTLIKDHRTEKNLATILTAQLPDPSGYGRIVRQADGSVSKIVEHLDASYDQRKILEINSGTYCFHAPSLTRILPKITNNNAKKEYYLTDAIELLRTEGRIGGYLTANSTEVLGVNNRSDMAKAEAHLFKKKNEILMSEGVTIIDPSSCYIGEEVKIGPDTVIWPQTMIFGHTTIGKNCQIGPWTKLNNMTIADEVIVQASFCEDSVVRTGARVGPYSRVRPHSDIGAHVHLGNFSEVKNTTMKEGAKANHLAYLGDAIIGKNANIGAGSITCNYDGIKKSPTHIQDHAFIGSNVNLIAPVTVGAHSVIGAGSTISENVPPWALALERSEKRVKKNWAKKKFKKGS